MPLRIDGDAGNFTQIEVVGHLQEVHVPVERNSRWLGRHRRRRGASMSNAIKPYFMRTLPERLMRVVEPTAVETSIRPGPQNDNCARAAVYSAVSRSRISPVSALSCTTTDRLLVEPCFGGNNWLRNYEPDIAMPCRPEGPAPQQAFSAPPINGSAAFSRQRELRPSHRARLFALWGVDLREGLPPDGGGCTKPGSKKRNANGTSHRRLPSKKSVRAWTEINPITRTWPLEFTPASRKSWATRRSTAAALGTAGVNSKGHVLVIGFISVQARTDFFDGSRR